MIHLSAFCKTLKSAVEILATLDGCITTIITVESIIFSSKRRKVSRIDQLLFQNYSKKHLRRKNFLLDLLKERVSTYTSTRIKLENLFERGKKAMRSSIYQDFKNSSSGEVFYSNENFEKDFLELIRLEKNLTGRDFDLTQRQFSECKFCPRESINDCLFSNKCIGRR